MSVVRPIEIIGGGLAGLSLGLALRRVGARVALYEAGRYPRHRVCGEFITGLGESTIARLGLAPFLANAPLHHEIAWYVGDESKPSRVQRLPHPALGLSRFALDARLADAFVAAGGELHIGSRVTDLAPRAGRIFATGRRRGRSNWLGLKCHVHHYSPVRDLELHLGDEAYVGCSRVEDGTTNVCGLFRRRALKGQLGFPDAPTTSTAGPIPFPPDATARHIADCFFAYLRAAGLNEFAAKLERAGVLLDSCAAVAAMSFARTVTVDTERLTLGDASAMIPPFTGNGMAMAFQSAELALDPLIEYAAGERDWDSARDEILSAQRRRFKWRLAAADWLHPFLLRPRRQRWFARLNRNCLLPFRPFYAALH